MRAARTLLIGTAVAALLGAGCEWHFETLDGAGGPNGRTNNMVGTFGSTVIYNGRPHIFYYDRDDDTLRHGYYDGTAWNFETLDGNGGPNGRITADVGAHTAAVVYNGRPHVFYATGTGDLRHAYWNGLFWSFEALDGVTGSHGETGASVGQDGVALLYNGRPHVFYREYANDHLRHAYWNGQFWAFETLDGAGGPDGRTTNDVGQDGAALLYNGRPHVFYYDSTDDNLRHAYWNGQSWAFETLDGAGGPNGRADADVGRYNATLLYNGRPHVFFHDADLGIGGGNLRHAYWNGFFWSFEALDGAGGPDGRVDGFVGEHATVLLYNGRPHAFYWDRSSGTLRHAYWNGLFWAFEILDGPGGKPGHTDSTLTGMHNVAILYNGRPHVFSFDDIPDTLRHTYFG